MIPDHQLAEWERRAKGESGGGHNANQRILQLVAALREAREALRPFAEESKSWPTCYGDGQCVAQRPLADYRRAAAAMEGE